MAKSKASPFIQVSFEFDAKEKVKMVDDEAGIGWCYKSFTSAKRKDEDKKKYIFVKLLKSNPYFTSSLLCLFLEGKYKVKFKLYSNRKFEGSRVTLSYINVLQQNTLPNSIYSDLLLQARNGEYVTLVAKDGQTFTISKLIFTSRSEVFAKMLTSPMLESQTQTIKMDIEPRVMEALLYFLNTDKIINKELMCDLALLGDQYDLPLLVRLCADALVSTLNQNNLEMYSRIAAKYRCIELSEAICDFMLPRSSSSEEEFDDECEELE